MRWVVAPVLLAVLFALVSLSLAQDGTYRLQPEDILRIIVYNEGQINAQIPIGKDGNISAPFVGTVRAAGRTTAELEAILAQEYKKSLNIRDPRVSVTIERYRVLKASVGGFVGRPGNYEIRPGDTILAVLNQAGGPVFDRANLRRATLRHAGSMERIPIDLNAMLVFGDTSQNYEVADGDELIVPEDTQNTVKVLGAVNSPGQFLFRDNMTVADALSLSRGEIRQISKLSEVLVIRKLPGSDGQYVQIKANFVRFVRKQDFSQNVELQPGDIVYIPSTNTPTFGEIGQIVNAAFFLDRVFTQGIFGIRPVGGIGR